MFDVNVLFNRHAILTIGTGLILVLTLFLSYLPSKRPRYPELFQLDEAPRPSTWREAWGYVPWILILTYIGTFIYSVIDMTWKSSHPPNY
jgi:predicted membrane metal-binding protein